MLITRALRVDACIALCDKDNLRFVFVASGYFRLKSGSTFPLHGECGVAKSRKTFLYIVYFWLI